MQLEGALKLIRNLKVNGLSADSKQVGDNFIFVAVRGAVADGSKFIQEAVLRGAKIVVCDKSAKVSGFRNVDFVKVEDTRKALAVLASEFYGRPSGLLKTVAVTGTNGKTTVTYLLEALLKEKRISSGVIGTINHRFGKKVIAARNTTPGPLELQSVLAQMLKSRVKYVAMEVSSHALDQGRVSEVDFDSAIFTNLTQDHLDYHGNMEEYFLAKAKLFKNLKTGSFAVINNDDRYSVRLKKMTEARVITYGIDQKSDFTAKNINSNVSGTEFTLVYKNKETKLKMRLIGRHNVYNALAVIAWAKNEGFGLRAAAGALEKFSSVPGRLERISAKKGFFVFVDYAHTDDALKNIITSLRQLSPKRIITLFGCGGDRDKLKRPKMGKVVTELSDFAVLTTDNPRSEDPAVIIKDILKGVKKTNYCVVLDRSKAIKYILGKARPGDIVVLAGKGHEDYQIIKGKKLHFSDLEEARKCLKSLN